MHQDYFEYWLENFVKDGTCLNVCCGLSNTGQVRVDIAKYVKLDGKKIATSRTMEGDLFKIQEYFHEESFDYVYCDPPFPIYTSGPNRMRWQFDLFKLVKPGGALITRRPKVSVNMPSKWHEYIIAEDDRPSLTLVRIDYK